MLTYLERSKSTDNLFGFIKQYLENSKKNLVYKDFLVAIRKNVTVDIGGGSSRDVENFVLNNDGTYINVDPHPKARESGRQRTSLVPMRAEEYLDPDEEEGTRFYIFGGANFSLNGLDELSYDGDFKRLMTYIDKQMVAGNYIFGSGNHNLFTEYLSDDQYVKHISTDRFFLFQKK